MNVESYIRNIPDFPKPGIQFKDITPLLKNTQAFKKALEEIASQYSDDSFDIVVGIESRGFIFGSALALMLGKGFVPVRKPGKLPADTYSQSYELEYGTDTLEVHKDAIKPGQKVLIIDDLLATGGTMAASIELMKKCEADIVGCSFVIELDFLKGREKLQPYKVTSLINY